MTTYTYSPGGINDFWSNSGNWSPNGVPGGSDTANIDHGSGQVEVNDTEQVGTLNLGTVGIGALPTLLVDGGNSHSFTINTAATNDATINVAVGSNFVVGGTLTNSDTLTVGLGASRSSSGTANLKLVGTVTLNGSGTVQLGTLNTNQLGNILNDTSGDGLTNVDNTIRGVGTIGLTNFENKSGAKVTAEGSEGDTLQVYATSNWTNAGTYTATTRNSLELGNDGTTTTLHNTGSIELDTGSQLEIAGTLTLAGGGSVGFGKGAGAEITSDGSTATLINEGELGTPLSDGTIGDSHLTLSNEGGTVGAFADSVIINTGSNTVDTFDGGVLEADAGDLYLDSPVSTAGIFGLFSGGTVEAIDYGVVVVNAAIQAGLPPVSGQVLIDGYGTVSVGNGGSISAPINFSGAGGILQVTNASDVISGQITMAAGDFLDLTAMPFPGSSANWVENGGGTAGVLTVTSGSKTELFNINGNFSNASFGMFNDGNGGTEIGVTNAAPPSGNTAVMVMSNGPDGDYEIYDVGGNAIESAYTLGQIAEIWNFVGLGTLQAGDSNDMLFRDGANFEAYYVNSNTITSSALVGSVGTNWDFSGLGNFDGASSLSELLLRNSTSGAFELYHVEGGGTLAGSAVAAVGNNLQVSGFGYFSETGTEQMAMEQANVSPSSNAYWLYTYNPATNSYASAGPSGTIGSNLSVVGVADLLGNGSSELIMEQANVTPGTNAYWAYVYNPSNNTFDAIGNKALGTVGNNFNVVGFGPLGTTGQDEMLMQDAAGDFEVYQYSAGENAFVGTSMGAVGAPWMVDGIAANPSGGGASAASTAQLTQAMASFGTTAAPNSAPVPVLGVSERSQQALLTTPHA